ncbi:PfkB family carbohydrate kinase [Glutamicibacter sp. MNS18]|uniref:PfkB family carbohydrate kinase n=1 Tax=Glutamicibacter sp. MNS18 TaxID=2989817 RepID=UPI0022358082|nr:PfkB family carbohydrate kinase [Glutamicibacter sp. MNS18]MCW4464708.1 PfkB family carbohydrate kinase [Glutamicibacter sp. MNS18]
MSGYELDQRPVEVVVIGSQLAYGAVGNNTVARMIEAGGHRCVQVPTVVLSNLPHYPTLAGGPVSDQWLAGFLDDLLAREVLDRTRYVFVGYLGTADQAGIIARWLVRARQLYPQLKLILDPAMGDTDVGMYAEPAVAEGYREHLLEQSWLTTPNSFELALFTGLAITDEQDAANACLELLELGCRHVVVTSTPSEDPGMVGCLLATSEEDFDQVDTPRVASTAKGAGDCFAGLLISQLLEGASLLRGVQHAVSGTALALSGAHRLFGGTVPAGS